MQTLLSKEGETTTVCRVLFLERPRDAPSKAYVYDGTISHEIPLSGLKLSEPIRLTPGADYVAMIPHAIAEPQNLPAKAPRLRIPEGVNSIYLVCISDPKNPVFPVQLQMIDVSDNKVREGQTLWMNFTNHHVVCKLGKQRIQLQAGQKSIAKAPISGSGYYKAQFAYKSGGKGDFLPIMNKTWWLDEKSRYLGIVIGTGERLPKIYSLRDRVYADAELEEDVIQEVQETE